MARAVAAGTLDVVIGTHALLRESIVFARLGLVIVDEQHRLGVAQRLALVAKGRDERGRPLAPHLLTVSATPIPRTLSLALRGEIVTAHLDQRPAGRQTPTTRVVARSRWGEIVGFLQKRVAAGERAFVVCATIDRERRADTESDGGSSEAAPDDPTGSPGAKARADELMRALGSVVLVHGGLEDPAKRSAISAFRSGAASVLVGTSMLEVGLDVPEATVMVIDGADRFGLSQLHQLRGRVGRGDRPGVCILVHGEPLAAPARDRLLALAAASDGMEVARADLRMRGAGDLDGARQSGEASGLRYLDPLADEPIIEAAAAAMVEMQRNPMTLHAPPSCGLRRALARFDDAAQATELGVARSEAG